MKTPPRNLVLVRHGESEANILQAAAKRGDESLYTPEVATYADHSWRLTPKGVKQVQATGAWLQAKVPPLDRFLVSPFTRTRETAAHLGLPQAAWEECRQARERSWGESGGLARSTYREAYPLNHRLKENDFLYWAPPAGESLASMAEGRVASLMRTLAREASGKNVLLVTHGEFTWATRLLLEAWTDEEFRAKDADPAWKVHNAHVQWYSSEDPLTGGPEEGLTWTRRAWPQEDASGSFTMKETPWQKITKPLWSNEDLLAKVEEVAPRYR